VSFSYQESDALTDVSFTIKPHQTIGIIGGTGSGKSTLVNLIPRFYEAQKGRITIKDQDIKDYTFAALRKMIGFVPQAATLFSGTIRENLLWGNKEASEEDIQKALEISQAKEIVDKMKEGLDTRIEASGKNVSGGQRQRLTIARALVRQPEILILDDSASALDFATDAKLRRALKTLDTTTIIVSQRVSALRHADAIIVLDHGAVSAIGSHDTLMQTSSLYQEIVHSQEEGDTHEA
jgi:ATP-binding cassette subfamily B protein